MVTTVIFEDCFSRISLYIFVQWLNFYLCLTPINTGSEL